MDKFSRRLRELRTENGLTQQELGELVGKADNTVSGWESSGANGKFKKPDYETIIRLANGFNVTTDYLLGISDIKRAHKYNSKTHIIKITPEYFKMKVEGNKPFELRINDRGYCKGDVLIEQEFDDKTSIYSGRIVIERVLDVIEYPAALKDGYVCLGTEILEVKKC